MIDAQTGEVLPDAVYQSQSLNELAASLASAQAEMQNAALNRKNSHFGNKYADLASIRDATIPVLAKHKLSVVQFTTMRNGTLVLRTRLLHSSGQWIEGEYPLPAFTDKPQVMGSALTYARRYCLSSIVGIAADEDDDAEIASKTNGQPQPKNAADKLHGPLKITELKNRMRDFKGKLDAVKTKDELDALLAEYDAVLKQCEADIPGWWAGQGDAKGAMQAIEEKTDEVLDRAFLQGDTQDVPHSTWSPVPIRVPTTADGESADWPKWIAAFKSEAEKAPTAALFEKLVELHREGALLNLKSADKEEAKLLSAWIAQRREALNARDAVEAG